MEGRGRPTGTVTFLLTDIQGSTELWERETGAMEPALRRHDTILRRVVDDHGGYVFATAGDAFAAAFETPVSAARAADEAQRALDAEPWPTSTPLRVRMGLHTGVAEERDGNYFGPAVNRAARLMSAAHGGQVLLSNATAQLLGRSDLVDLGEHRLKDLSAPEHVWQLGTAHHPPIRTLERRLHNLPVQHGELIGRAEDLRRVTELVRAHRLVSLIGLGGAGKTRLALATAAEVVEDFPDGVWFVDLVPVHDGAHLPEAIADAAGLRMEAGASLDRLAAALGTRRTLLVLDNCEHLTAQVADAVDVLLEQSAASVLVTSRELLDLPDEWPYRVQPLPVEERLDAPAVQLLAAAALRSGVQLGPDDVVPAASVCRHLDGLPLALELAGAQLRTLTLVELSERLDRRFELLARSRRGRHQRQASLFGVIEDTWALLGTYERELLRQLAAFAGTFDVATVEVIGAGLSGTDVVRTLGNLVDRSLVVLDAEGLRLLETVKLFARRRWADDDAVGGYLERHTAWALEHIGRYTADERQTSFELASWASRQADELRAIEARLVEQGRLHELVELLSAHNFGIGYGPSARALALTERVEGYLGIPGLDDSEAGRLHLLIALAAISSRDRRRLAHHGETAIRLLSGRDRPHDLAMAMQVTAMQLTFRDQERGLWLFDEAISVAERSGAATIAAYCLSYRIIGEYWASEGASGLAALDGLAKRLDPHSYTAPHSVHSQASVVRNLVRDPMEARAACVRMLESQSAHGVSVSVPWLAYDALTLANLADVRAAERAVEALRTEHHRNGDPRDDELLPIALLAWRLGRSDLARRWMTARRHAGPPRFGLHHGGTYLELVAAIGVEDRNPLEGASMAEIIDEATAWLTDVAIDDARSPAGPRSSSA